MKSLQTLVAKSTPRLSCPLPVSLVLSAPINYKPHLLSVSFVLIKHLSGWIATRAICQQLMLSIEMATCQEQRVSYLWQQAGLWPLQTTCRCRTWLRIAGELHTVCRAPSHLPLFVRLCLPAVKASEVCVSCHSDYVEQESLSPDSKGVQTTLKLTQPHSCKPLGNGASPYRVGSGKERGQGCKDKSHSSAEARGLFTSWKAATSWRNMLGLNSSCLRLLWLSDKSNHGAEARDKGKINVPWSTFVQKSHTDKPEQL